MAWVTPTKQLSGDKRLWILNEYMRCAQGRQRLAKSLVKVASTHIGYHAIYRRILQREDIPFCEPQLFEEVVQADDIETFTGEWHRVTKVLSSEVDRSLAMELEHVERAIVDCVREALERASSFSVQPGHVLLNARDYAEVRKFCWSLTSAKEERFVLDNRPHFFNNMVFRTSRLIPVGLVLFIPTPSGRYCENLEIEVNEEPNENGRPSFLFREKCCLDLDYSKILGFEIHRS